MRRIALWLAATAAVLVLLFSYRTSTMGAGGSPPAVAGPPADNTPGLVPQNTPTPGGSAVVVNGTVSHTRWGPVQVQVHLSGGRIADVVALQAPDRNGRDREISAY